MNDRQTIAKLEETIAALRESERRRTEQEIRLHGEILRSMAEGVVLVRTNDNAIVYANPTFERMFGYEPGELLNKHVSVVNAPADKKPEETADAILTELVSKGFWQGEVLNIRKDGSVFWCSANVSAFEDSQYGNVWVSVHQDIDKHKIAELKLQEKIAEAQRLREALDNVSSYVFMKDTESRYVYGNRLTLELFGCGPEELVGQSDARFFPPDTVKRLRDVDARVCRGEQTAEEIDVDDAGDRRRVYWEVKTPIFSGPDRKEVWGLLGISTDITERKNMEEERERLIADLRQALASVKTLSGMLPICAYCKKIRDDKGYWEEVVSYITKHSGALFSHGLCPGCEKRLAAELDGPADTA